MPNLRATSNFCAIYSVVGVIFMSMVFAMLTYQDFFIGGIEDLDQAKGNAKGGLKSFVCLFLLSVAYIVYDALNGGDKDIHGRESRHSFGSEYHSVPTSGIDGPDLMLESMDFQPTPESSQVM